MINIMCISNKWLVSSYLIWRKLSQSDLVPEYKVDGSEARKSFQMIGALPFLPNGDVDIAWRLLRSTLSPEMSSLADYMEYA